MFIWKIPKYRALHAQAQRERESTAPEQDGRATKSRVQAALQTPALLRELQLQNE